MRATAAVTAAIAATAAACQPVATREPNTGGDQRLIVAERHPDRTIEVRLIPVDGAVPAGPGHSVYIWGLANGRDLAGADGKPLPSEIFDGLQVRVSDTKPVAGVGSCRRCPAQMSQAPQLVLRGQSCLLPEWLALRAAESAAPDSDLRAAELEDLRGRIRLEAPGECECPLPEIAPVEHEARVKLRVIEPEVEGDVFSAVAQTDGGDVILLSQRRTITLSGTVSNPRPREIEDLPFEGPVLAAGAFRGGRVFAASANPSPGTPRGAVDLTRYVIFGGDLEAPLSDDGAEVRPFLFRRFPSAPELLHAIGSHVGYGAPGIAVCPEAALDARCARITPDVWPDATFDDRFSDAVRLPGDMVSAVGDRGLAFGALAASKPACERLSEQSDPDGLTWYWSAASTARGPIIADCDAAAIPACGGLPSPRLELSLHTQRLGHLGNRVFLSLYSRMSLEGRPLVLTQLMTPSAVCNDPRSGWRIAWVGGGTRCLGFTPIPGPPGQERIRFACDDGSGVDFDAAGNVVAQSPREAGLSNSPEYHLYSLTSTPGWILAASPGGEILRRENREGARFEHVFGSNAEPGRFEGPIVFARDRFWAFGLHGMVSWFRTDARSDAIERGVAGKIADLGGCWVPSAAALDSATQDIVVTGHQCAGEHTSGPWIYRFQPPDRGRYMASELLAGSFVVAMAETSPGSLVLALSETRILRLEGETLREVSIDWDDPVTVEKEDGPAPEVCGARNRTLQMLHRAGDRDHLWLNLSASHGVAWASGCDGTVVRIWGDRAQRHTIDLGTSDFILDGRTFTAIHAFCPDDVRLADTGKGLDLERGQFFRITQDGSGDTLRMKPDSVFLRAQRSTVGIGHPSAVLSTRGRILVTYGQGDPTSFVRRASGSIYESDTGIREHFPLSFLGGAVSPDGVFLINSEEGKVWAGAPP